MDNGWVIRFCYKWWLIQRLTAADSEVMRLSLLRTADLTLHRWHNSIKQWYKPTQHNWITQRKTRTNAYRKSCQCTCTNREETEEQNQLAEKRNRLPTLNDIEYDEKFYWNALVMWFVSCPWWGLQGHPLITNPMFPSQRLIGLKTTPDELTACH